MHWMSESHLWYRFLKEVKSAETLQPGLEFDNSKLQLKSNIFKFIN